MPDPAAWYLITTLGLGPHAFWSGTMDVMIERNLTSQECQYRAAIERSKVGNLGWVKCSKTY